MMQLPEIEIRALPDACAESAALRNVRLLLFYRMRTLTEGTTEGD